MFFYQESDIEMDIGPVSQKHNTRSKDAEADEPSAKRQKLCDESPSEHENMIEEVASNVPDEPIEQEDSSAKVT